VIDFDLYFVLYEAKLILYTLKSSPYEVQFHSESYLELDSDTRLWVIGALLQHHNLTDEVLEKKVFIAGYVELPVVGHVR
jgi:hypothetical protein